MKSLKLFATSIFSLLFSLVFFAYACIDENAYGALIVFAALALISIVFFILGWAVKDKSKPPRDTENDKDTKK